MNLQDSKPTREEQIREYVHKQAEFFQHLMVYLGVNIGLWTINAYQVMTYNKVGWWAFWPMFGWGIGVLAHAAGVFLMNNARTRAWEERKVAEMLDRELKK